MRIATIFALALAALLTSGASALAQQPTTTRATLSSVGAEANGASDTPGISADGRWVVFASDATNLVQDDTNGVADIFLRDRVTGRTTRVNVGPGGAQAGTRAQYPAISADGRTIAFVTTAALVAGAPAGFQIYAADRAGGLRRIALPAGVSVPRYLALSDDGARLAFMGFPGGGRTDVYVAETAGGAARRMSELPGGIPANGASNFDPAISGDGRWVAFTTDSTNLAPPDGNGYRDVVAREVDTGSFTRVSVGNGGAEANLHSSTPALSFDGCEIAFLSSATNLVTGDVAGTKAYVRRRCAGDTELLSRSNGGAPGQATAPLAISADGCAVTFRATDILSPPPGAAVGAALRDPCAGLTSRVDLSTTGEPGNGSVVEMRISATGRYVAFTSAATTLVAGDGNATTDVFVRDRATNRPPEAALTLSRDGRRVTADATASRDIDGPPVSGRISFGDGSPEATGLQAVHEYPRGGTYTVLATVVDADGATSTKALPVTVPDPVDPGPPGGGRAPDLGRAPDRATRLVLDGVSLSRSRFAVVRKGGRPGGRRGATLKLRLSAPAAVQLRFERARKGRRVRGRCDLRARRGRRCTRYSTVGTLRRQLGAGTQSIALTGRIGSRALARGLHRLQVSARAADGRASTTRTLTLTITG